ncbi:TPA: hypothetical protein ACH3X1_001962 [Trebouxia sp. C0004]
MPGQAWQEGVFDEEDEPVTNVNRLVQDKVYATIGHNACLEARPSVVHFGGFIVGSVHEQRVRLCNTSSSSTGTQIILPTTPYFKACCDNKKGLLAPGLEDVITVEFCPTEWRYYYDCLRIHSQGKNLLIPIHAYPMMNQTKFPRRISFGKCAVGETYTKRVSLTCNVPIDFEYEITMLEASAAFVVQPQHGVVPANGIMEIQVTFNPSRLVTEVVELEFQSETVRCTLYGSGFPGLARQHQLAGLTAGLRSTLPEEALLWGKAETGRLPKGTITTGKGGAGGGDAYTRLQTQKQQQGGPRDSRITGPIKAKLPALRPPTPPSKVEGLVVPAHPNQQAHMATLLNQQPGKLMLTDIQVAIEEKNKVLAEKEATLRRTLGRSKDKTLDPLDDSSLPVQTKADWFEYLCLEAQQQRRDVELKALEPQVGSDPLTPPQLAQIREARKQHQQQAAANQRQAAVQRTAVEMQAAAASAIRPLQQADQETAEASSSEGPNENRSVAEAAGASATAQPQWDCDDGDTWHKRQQVMHRFAQAGRKVMHRARAARRLALINTLVQTLKDPQSSQTLDNSHAIAGTAASTDIHQQAAKQQQHQAQAAFKFDVAQVLPTLPVHTDVPFMQYTPVEVPQYSVDFSGYEPMEPQVPKYYELMGYTEEPLPPFTPYAPLMLDQPFMEGAFEEEAGPHPTGLAPDLSDWLAMPDFCLQRSQPDLPIGNRYSTDKVRAQLSRTWGQDAGSAIQPRIYVHPSILQLELPESASVRVLAGQPVLSDLFVPFQQPQQAQSAVSSKTKKHKGDAVRQLRDQLHNSHEPAQQIQPVTVADIRKFMPADLQYVSPPAEGQLLDKPELHQEAAQLKTGDAQQPAAISNSQAQSAETAFQKYSKQLDQKLVVREQDNLSRLQAKFAAYNATTLCASIDSLP